MIGRGQDSLTHAPRYDTIATILRKFGADMSVLDVGCGEATLRARLPKNTRYVGIERSGAAARIALKRTNSIDIIHTPPRILTRVASALTASCLMKCFITLMIQLVC